MAIRFFERNRTSTIVVMYSLYLYFLGLSLRITSKALEFSKMKNEVILLYGIGYKGLVHVKSINSKRVSAFIIDETVIQMGGQHFWLWFCIEPIHCSVLGIYISEERNMIIAEKFIRVIS